MGDYDDIRSNRNRRPGEQSGGNLFGINLSGIDEKFLLPIIAVFMLNNQSIDSPLLNNLKGLTNEIIKIPSRIDLSEEDMKVMKEAIDSVSPYMNPDNIVILDTFSTIVTALHKISTVKEFEKDMARNSPTKPNETLKFKNQREKALQIIGTLEQFMDEPTKKNMQSLKSTIGALDKFQETSKTFSEKRKNGGSLDINDMVQLVRPLLATGNFPEIQKIDNMIRMFQIMSALEDTGGAGIGNPEGAGIVPGSADIGNPVGSSDIDIEDDDDDGAFFEFVIDRYDDDDDE